MSFPILYQEEMQKITKSSFTFFFLLLGFSFLGIAQREIPPRPSLQTSVYDEADILSPDQERSLEQKLINYADTTTTQIVVVTIESLNGEYENIYATNWAHAWGIGQAKEDNGLLILVSKGDRRIAISTGYGLEEYLTDAKSKDIIENIILPQFRNNDYYAGLDQGTTALFKVLDGSFQGTRPQGTGGGSGIPLPLLILGIFFLIFLVSLSKKNRNNGRGPGNRGG